MALELYVDAALWSPDAPLNTDARPVIERMAPRTQRAVLAGAARFLTGPERDRLYDDHVWPEDPR